MCTKVKAPITAHVSLEVVLFPVTTSNTRLEREEDRVAYQTTARVICGLHSSRARNVSGRHRQPSRRRAHSHILGHSSLRLGCATELWRGLVHHHPLFFLVSFASLFFRHLHRLPVCVFIASASSSSAPCDLRCHWFPSEVPLFPLRHHRDGGKRRRCLVSLRVGRRRGAALNSVSVLRGRR